MAHTKMPVAIALNGSSAIRSASVAINPSADAVVHGGAQGWWIAPLLASSTDLPLFLGATLLTAINDNALITHLATLVPDLTEDLKIAAVQGGVTGGGLTVIANAPNPAGQAILCRFFGGAIAPLNLFLGALIPTGIAILAFRMMSPRARRSIARM